MRTKAISSAPRRAAGCQLLAHVRGRRSADLGREIVRRGHEVAAHGRTWQNSYLLDPDAERRFITDGMESIHKATGQTPVGWNASYVRK